MSQRVKRSIWKRKRVPTTVYQSRNVPVETVTRMKAIAGLLDVTREQVLAMALEIGLDHIQTRYVGGPWTAQDSKKMFLTALIELFEDDPALVGAMQEPVE